MQTAQFIKLAGIPSLLLAASTAACSSSSSAGAAAPDDAGTTDSSTGPVTGLAAATWTWVPVAGAECRDGSPTGFAVNTGTKTDKLMIFLEGGGACFNQLTCETTPSAFGESTFASWSKGTNAAIPTQPSAGILNRSDAANPMKDWNFVYIPYCTGDIFAGNNPGGTVPSVTAPQQFVGYVDVGLDLGPIIPTFSGLSQVLLTGISAGGFGAAANYVQVAKAFGSTPVTLLDDSGPAFENPYLATCLQSQLTTMWRLDKTVLADCGSDCNDPASELLQYAEHIGKAYPHNALGLIESTGDTTISQFFGFGQNDCANALDPISAATFTAGLQDLREKVAPSPNFATFFFAGSQHTTLGIPPGDGGGAVSFDMQSTVAMDTFADGDAGPSPDASTIKLTDWVNQLVVGGSAPNVGP